MFPAGVMFACMHALSPDRLNPWPSPSQRSPATSHSAMALTIRRRSSGGVSVYHNILSQPAAHVHPGRSRRTACYWHGRGCEQVCQEQPHVCLQHSRCALADQPDIHWLACTGNRADPYTLPAAACVAVSMAAGQPPLTVHVANVHACITFVSPRHGFAMETADTHLQPQRGR